MLTVVRLVSKGLIYGFTDFDVDRNRALAKLHAIAKSKELTDYQFNFYEYDYSTDKPALKFVGMNEYKEGKYVSKEENSDSVQAQDIY